VILVGDFDGEGGGRLELRAQRIEVDATSMIVATATSFRG
jgi:hypothetical protein